MASKKAKTTDVKDLAAAVSVVATSPQAVMLPTIAGKELSVSQATAKLNELDAYVRTLQSERSKLQSTINFFLDELLKISNTVEFPKRLTLPWLLLNIRSLIKIVEMVIALVKEAKNLKKK